MAEGWSRFWADADNLHWGAVDRQVLRHIADAIGPRHNWEALEVGAGRGFHSHALWLTARVGKAYAADTEPIARVMCQRNGLTVLPDNPARWGQFDLVWSYGLCEHGLDAEERQRLVDLHFLHAKRMVLIIVPARNWQRRWFPSQCDQLEFSVDELRERIDKACTTIWAESTGSYYAKGFAPLFGVRHIPDSVYPILDRMTRKILKPGLLMAVAQRG